MNAMAAAWLLILIAFPYCFTRFFFERFGHISVLGMSILVATLILAGNRRAKLPQQIAIACLAVLVCIYYLLSVSGVKIRARDKLTADWS
jgi:hypothetical protein